MNLLISSLSMSATRADERAALKWVKRRISGVKVKAVGAGCVPVGETGAEWDGRKLEAHGESEFPST